MVRDLLTVEAFPAWRAANPGRECPERLDHLAPWMDHMPAADMWGRPFGMRCVIDANATALLVWSRGADGELGTDDDVWSDGGTPWRGLDR